MELPINLPDLLREWYCEKARDLPWRQDREPYHIWLSEIMLQQTRVEAVKGYYARFLDRYPTVEALAKAEPAALQKLWEGLGYYTRVRNLQAAARRIMEDYGGQFPRSYAQVLSLPGIGPYTAGAICSIAFNLPVPAVDGNVLRVISRLCALREPVTKERTKKLVADALRKIYPADASVFTQSLMELGATVCTPNGAPRCSACPLRTICCAGSDGTWADYPVKAAGKPRRVEDRTVFVLKCGGMQAVRKRPASGLLADLWEYPNVEGTLRADAALQQAAQWGCEPARLTMQLDRVHIFTHIQWNLRCYYIECRERPEGFVWATGQMLDSEITLPTAFRMFRIE